MKTTHVQSLENRRSSLKQAIHHESIRPSPDFLKIARLKKQKLAIKDEINTIRTHPNSLAG